MQYSISKCLSIQKLGFAIHGKYFIFFRFLLFTVNILFCEALIFYPKIYYLIIHMPIYKSNNNLLYLITIPCKHIITPQHHTIQHKSDYAPYAPHYFQFIFTYYTICNLM